MPTKKLGTAQYRAVRTGNMTMLIAIGETPNWNDKTDFEQLPFKIWPPMYAFYFVQADISLPARRPFVYEELIPFPTNADTVRIQDSTGFHSVRIEEITTTEGDLRAGMLPDSDSDYCVWSMTAADELFFIAKCDATLPAIYTQVFGPDTLANCEKYIKDHRRDL